jgi:putative N-acetylmannosamine-6-phosphate epimerase
MLPTLASFGAAILLVVLLLTKRERKAAVKEEPDIDLVVSTSAAAADPLHHQRVIAKTRQAAHISSAVAYNRAGEVRFSMWPC